MPSGSEGLAREHRKCVAESTAPGGLEGRHECRAGCPEGLGTEQMARAKKWGQGAQRGRGVR